TIAKKVTVEGGRQDTTHTENDKNKQDGGKVTAEEATRAERAGGIEDAIKALKGLDPKVITGALAKAKVNENKMAAADKTSQSGIAQSVATEGLLRGTTFAPSSKLQGLNDKEQSAVSNVEAWNQWVLHDLTGAAASAHEEIAVGTAFTIGPDDT